MNDCKVIYFWYHHMMSDEDRKETHKAIQNKDFSRFKELQDKWNMKYRHMVFLPATASIFYHGVIVGEIYVDIKEGFNLIDEEECEYG